MRSLRPSRKGWPISASSLRRPRAWRSRRFPLPPTACVQRREVAFADLLEIDFVGHERGSSIQVFLESHAKRLHRTLRHRIQLGNFESICRLVENGVGVAVLPESAARRFQRSMRVRLLRITDAWAVRKILICVNDLDRLPSSTRRLVEHLARLGAASG
jgi:DNA-binding transcriptional LysR family regulator